MSSQDRVKIFQRAMARYGLYTFYWVFSWLPYTFIKLITHILLSIGFTFTIRQRRVAEESLKIAFGKEKTHQEIRKIIRECFEDVGLGLMEMLYFLSHRDEVSKKVSFEGKSYLDQAIRLGRGVVAVTAHFGNFPLMMYHCALQGYKTNAIIRRTRDQEVEEFLFKKRTEAGLNTIYAVPRQKCVTESLKVLRNNEILFIPLDQNFGSEGGVFVDFFGQRAATATGPVVFSNRTGALIVPMFIIRQKDDTHKIIVEPPLNIEEREDEQEMLVVNIAKITKIIEGYIRRYPHEWGWMHRRWKSRPYETKYLPNA